MESKYTHLLTESHLMVQSVKSDLTPALSEYSVSFLTMLGY
jgi:hypothetical protein